MLAVVQQLQKNKTDIANYTKKLLSIHLTPYSSIEVSIKKSSFN